MLVGPEAEKQWWPDNSGDSSAYDLWRKQPIRRYTSIMGLVDKEAPADTAETFRSVHQHTATKAALIGGGLVPTPE